MPYTLKTSQISVKDPETGEYSGVDILAEQTEQGLIAELQAEGTTQVNRINQAAVDVQAAVDQAENDAATIISNTQTSINTLEAQKNTIAQTVASMAELGTDTTLSTPGMAADAGAVGDLSRQLNDVEENQIPELKSAITIDTSIQWVQGWYGRTTGSLNPQTTAISSEILPLDTISITCVDDTIHFKLYGWENGAYRGQWRGNKWSTGSGDYYITEIDLKTILMQYPNYMFALTVFKKDGSAIDTTSGPLVNVVRGIFSYTEKTAYTRSCTRYGGFDINPGMYGINYVYYDRTLPDKPTGASARQGMDIYDGVIYILCSDDKLLLVDLKTMTAIAMYDIKCDHGNSCQFARAIETGENIPHLWCFGYNTKYVYENSINDNGTQLIRTFYLPIDGYRMSGGVDTEKNVLFTVHYKLNSSTNSAGNNCVLTVWDLNELTENEDGSYTPAVKSEADIPFIYVIQDCKIINGLLYISSGYPATGHQNVTITVCNYTQILNSVDVFSSSNAEPEGIALAGNNIYIATNRIYILSFV